jgi:GGDEF domain-containing protein
MMKPSYILPEDQFMFLLEVECNRAVRLNQYLSVVMVKLKRVEAGEHLLFQFAELMRDEIREIDVFGALQDKKVGIIVWSTDPEELLGIMARVRRRFKEQSSLSQEDPFSDSIRIGGACFPTHATTAQELLLGAEKKGKDL